MKSHLFSLAVIGSFAIAAGSAMAEPVKLTNSQMDRVTAGVNPHLTTVIVNPGGVTGAGNSCTSNPNCTTLVFKTTGRPS